MKPVHMRLGILLLLLPWFGVAAPVTTNGDFLVTTWRSEAGLPHDSITCLTQTRDGCLWVGTHMGMARFDGTRFDCFSLNNFRELGADWVTDIFQDRDGTLLIAVETGRIVGWRNGQARICAYGKGENHAITRMAQDAAGTTWLATAEGELCKLTPNGEAPAATGAGPNPAVFSLVADSQGRLWAGTSVGLRSIVDGALHVPDGLEPLTSVPVRKLASGKDSSLWAVVENQLWKVQGGKAVMAAELPPQVGTAGSLLEDTSGRVWIGAVSGELFFLDPAGGWQMVPLEAELRGAINTLFEDREGNLWCGSFGGGLRRIRPRLFKVHRLPVSGLDPYVFNVCSDPAGNVWAKFGRNSLVEIPAATGMPVIRSGPPVDQTISALFCDRGGALWIGTDGGRLYRMLAGQPVLELSLDGKATVISALFEDARSNLWVGFTGESGLGVLPRGQPARWQVAEGSPFNNVRAITEAADGAIWLGTYYHGAARLKDGHWTQFTTQDGLPSDYVRCLIAETNGSIWMGTLRGLCRWRNGRFASISAQNGLWNNSISHLASDGHGNLWLSSFGGIFRVSQRDLNECADGHQASIQCIGYNLNDGLPGLECPGGFQPAGTKTPDGRLWFPTEDGLVSIDADHLRENRKYPPVLIEQLVLDDVPHLLDPSMTIEKIPPGRHRLEFRFAALSFTAPEKVRFRHKLENFDTEWSPSDDQRQASYNFIPPGRYDFRVTGCNNDGAWNPAEASLALVVQPYFWQTLWFRLGVALGLVLATVLTIRHVERRWARLRLERIERQHTLDLERARIAKDIHDDLGATLTQIALLCNRIQDCKDLGSIGQWNRRIETASQCTIQSLDEIVWAINPKHDTLESLANHLSSFAQEHLELAGIRCVLDVQTVFKPLKVDAEARHNIFLAARQALQNAVAHARATEVQVQLKFDGELLEITIADNGRGFAPPEVPRRGNGLANMRKRLDDIGGSLEISSRPGKGTVVSIRVSRARLHAGGLDESAIDN